MHDRQVKTKDDLIKSLNKGFTEKIKSMKSKIDTLEHFKKKKIKQEKETVQKARKLEKKARQKALKQETKHNNNNYDAVETFPTPSTESIAEQFKVLNNNNAGGLNELFLVNNDVQVDNLYCTHSSRGISSASTCTSSILSLTASLPSSTTSMSVTTTSTSPSTKSLKLPSLNLNPIYVKRIVNCEFCDQTFNWQDTFNWVSHEGEHIRADHKRKMT